jgi:hypothetical protein
MCLEQQVYSNEVKAENDDVNGANEIGSAHVRDRCCSLLITNGFAGQQRVDSLCAPSFRARSVADRSSAYQSFGLVPSPARDHMPRDQTPSGSGSTHAFCCRCCLLPSRRQAILFWLARAATSELRCDHVHVCLIASRCVLRDSGHHAAPPHHLIALLSLCRHIVSTCPLSSQWRAHRCQTHPPFPPLSMHRCLSCSRS